MADIDIDVDSIIARLLEGLLVAWQHSTRGRISDYRRAIFKYLSDSIT